jgi:hypothetical protein
LPQGLAALLVIGLPGLGQAHLPGGTHEQAHAQALFQASHRRLTAAGVTPAKVAAAVKLPASAARQNSSRLPSCRSSKWRVMAARLITRCID